MLLLLDGLSQKEKHAEGVLGMVAVDPALYGRGLGEEAGSHGCFA
jgi:hypothetical protein